MTPREAVVRAIQYAGTQEKLAELLECKQVTVSRWLRNENGMSADFALKCQEVTGGAVTVHELRPDLYPPEKIAVLSAR